jgi:oligopeptide/dipeptide ABC transporter ATP-binding protein
LNAQVKRGEPVLTVDGLKVSFRTRDGLVKAVRDVSFDLFPGEALGIVGESGCGKSVTALSTMKLIDCPPGLIEARNMRFNGMDILNASEKEMRKIRGNHISMIFQDPMTCLNPVLSVNKQMCEIMQLHLGLSNSEATERAIELLGKVGLTAPELRLKSYPHQLSGGIRQRIMIATAVSCNPTILLADEPTTALDVTIQDQILRLMKDLAEDLQMATILITHNLGAVAGFAHRVIVMYAGQIVELADANEIFDNPLHPYTAGLLASIPRMDEEEQKRLFSIKGKLPSPIFIPKGCAFAPRCIYAFDQCSTQSPNLEEMGSGHFVSCWKVMDGK